MMMHQRRVLDIDHYSTLTATISLNSTIHQQNLAQTKTHVPGLTPGNMGYFSSHKEQYYPFPV